MDDKTSLYIDNDTRVAPLKETLLEPSSLSNLESLPLTEVCSLLLQNIFMEELCHK